MIIKLYAIINSVELVLAQYMPEYKLNERTILISDLMDPDHLIGKTFTFCKKEMTVETLDSPNNELEILIKGILDKAPIVFDGVNWLDIKSDIQFVADTDKGKKLIFTNLHPENYMRKRMNTTYGINLPLVNSINLTFPVDPFNNDVNLEFNHELEEYKGLISNFIEQCIVYNNYYVWTKPRKSGKF